MRVPRVIRCFSTASDLETSTVFVLELLLQASQGDGLPTADHAAQGNQVPFEDGALDVDHELPVVTGFIVPVAQRLREPIMLHDVNPHGLS